MTTVLLVVYLLSCGSLLLYGLNCYVLLGLFVRRRTTLMGDPPRPATEEEWPLVATQIPLYNEANVARRLIDAVAAFEYPNAKHEIQILDDSSDETRAVVDEAAAHWRERGKIVTVVRRERRTGYKAGALREGVERSRAEFFAVFDADFVPPKDFLLRLVPHFIQDPGIGLVQSRWGHLNRGDSLLTRAQSLGIDGHFMIEQGGRAGNGLYLNFNGTAGIWRRTAIEGKLGAWKLNSNHRKKRAVPSRGASAPRSANGCSRPTREAERPSGPSPKNTGWRFRRCSRGFRASARENKHPVGSPCLFLWERPAGRWYCLVERACGLRRG